MTDRPRADQARRLEEPLRLLAGDEQRRAVLFALWTSPRLTATRSELAADLDVPEERVETHVAELSGTFVHETDEGVKLLPGANILLKTLGAYARPDVRVEPFETGGACQECGGALVARYEHQVAAVECSACGTPFFHLAFPPREAAERSREGFLWAFERRARTQLRLSARGVCYWCSGPIETTLSRPDGGEKEVHHAVEVSHTCRRCEGYINTTVGENVLALAPVVAFCHDRGVDLAAVPCWELSFAMAADAVAVTGEDPWRFEVTVEAGGDRLEVVLDGDLSVVETRER